MCSACVAVATVNVHGYEVCAEHGHGLMVAVLTGDFTPVGYIIAAACGEIEPPRLSVSSRKQQATVSPFMRHGAINPPEPSAGASHRSSKPGALVSHWPGR